MDDASRVFLAGGGIGEALRGEVKSLDAGRSFFVRNGAV
jgi:hypothetical protein